MVLALDDGFIFKKLRNRDPHTGVHKFQWIHAMSSAACKISLYFYWLTARYHEGGFIGKFCAVAWEGNPPFRKTEEMKKIGYCFFIYYFSRFSTIFFKFQNLSSLLEIAKKRLFMVQHLGPWALDQFIICEVWG